MLSAALQQSGQILKSSIPPCATLRSSPEHFARSKDAAQHSIISFDGLGDIDGDFRASPSETRDAKQNIRNKLVGLKAMLNLDGLSV
ncbi:hypothetical protein Hanom_Chr10g00958331 [Helianthus anomalus]